MSNISKITEYVVYEYDNKDKDIYKTENSNSKMIKIMPNEYTLEAEIAEAQRKAKWMDIYALSKRSPALQSAVDQAIMIFELQATEEDRSIMWYPV